jgi:hypothetical protein
MLWQVPCGNTLYLSCNNTWKHYQDNRPEYFLLTANRHHIDEYVAAGAIGILFGPGTDGCTSPYDGASDGITNPASVNGTSIAATVADDDGGFIRAAVNEYYAAGVVTWRTSGDGSGDNGCGGGCGAASARGALAEIAGLCALVFVLARAQSRWRVDRDLAGPTATA